MLHRLGHLLAAAFLTLLSATACANGRSGHFLSFVSENDIYVDARDRHYSAGNQLAFGFAPGTAPSWLSWPSALSPLDAGPASREVNLALGQVISTPEDLSAPSPPTTDRRYAGWLYGELSATTHGQGVEDELALSLGVLGPSSLADRAHKLLHDLTPSAKPRGWRTQLDDEPAVLLRARRSWFIPVKPDDFWRGDLVPRAQILLGNVFTEFDLGLAWRFGSHVPQRDMPARIMPGGASHAPRFTVRRGQIDWVFRADILGRVVAHNAFIDGSVFENSPRDLSSDTFSWDASAGVLMTFGNLSLPCAFSFTYTWRAKEFDGQRGINRFGSVSLAVKF